MDSTISEPTGPPGGQASVPPGSPPKAEDDLDLALNGQELTVKNMILAAIGIMKVSERTYWPTTRRVGALQLDMTCF
jgi:hypothetical protein